MKHTIHNITYAKKIINYLRNNPWELDRQYLVDLYIKGEGNEIGALHLPLLVRNKDAVVKYVAQPISRTE